MIDRITLCDYFLRIDARLIFSLAFAKATEVFIFYFFLFPDAT